MSIRTFATVAGLLYIGAAILGFFPGVTLPPPTHAPPLVVDSGYGYLLGLFPVNVLHNFVHLGIGIWGLISAKSAIKSRQFAIGIAWIYGLLAVIGFIPSLHTLFGFVPLFGHNIWLHAGTAAIAAYFGFIAPPNVVMQRRTNTGTDKVKVYEEHSRI